jgi:hypothetical protein
LGAVPAKGTKICYRLREKKVIGAFFSKLVQSAGITPTSADFTPEAFAAQVEAARERLRQAFRDRDLAAAAVKEAEGAVARVRQLIEAADVAAAALKEAEAKSAAYTQAWAESGAATDKPQTDPALVAAASAAAVASTSAQIAAVGAAAGLPGAAAALRQAQNAHDSALQSVGQHVASLLAAMLEPHFAAAANAATEFETASTEILSTAKALAGSWYSFSSNSTAAALLNRLQGLLPPVPPDTETLTHRSPDLSERSAAIVRLGHQLMESADAK